MTRSTSDCDAHRLRQHLQTELDDSFDAGSALLCNPSTPSGALHLAVMRGPYLNLILAGRKTIESRFHRVRQPPLHTAAPGDVVAFKASGGPVRAAALISDATFIDTAYVPLSEVRAQYQAQLAAVDDIFWDERADARWVSLLTVSNAREISPLSLAKRDRRGWVAYDRSCLECAQPALAAPIGL